MPASRFNLDQIALLNRSRATCEGLVAEHFRIPALPSSLYPYEVATLSELADGERSTAALAHLVIDGRPRAGGVEHLYRVCLMDDLILARAADEQDAGLRSLLSYVLAHELIHVVRFCRDEQSYDLSHDQREVEERQVHRLTMELLAGLDLPGASRLERLWDIDRLTVEERLEA